jgi:hypothetical protein
MDNKNLLTKILAIAGLVLVWFTILSPLVLAIIFLASGGGFHFDFLMPAELFMVALVGGLLLLWGALRARMRVKWISWTLIAAVVVLVGGQVLAEITGLAKGVSGAAGWIPVVLGMIVLYDLLIITLGVGGWCLCRDIIRKE